MKCGILEFCEVSEDFGFKFGMSFLGFEGWYFGILWSIEVFGRFENGLVMYRFCILGIR